MHVYPSPQVLCIQLIEPYVGCGHQYYYSSLPLASTLHSLTTSFIGTINKNRVDLPLNVHGPLHMTDGKVVAYRVDHLFTLAWQEEKKKPVIMLSTTCSAAMKVLTTHSKRPVSKPTVVDCYNHFMNGVDIANHATCSVLVSVIMHCNHLIDLYPYTVYYTIYL